MISSWFQKIGRREEDMARLFTFLVLILAVVYGANATCRDKSKSCPAWRDSGYCKKTYVEYMKKNCPMSCLYCTVACKDESKHCSAWRDYGYCKDFFVDYMKKHCKATCGFCKSATTLPPAPPTFPPTAPPTTDPYPDCRDKNSYCSSYAKYCNDPDYIDYVKKECKRTCNFCHLTTLPPTTTKPQTTKLYTVPGGSKSLQPGCGIKGPSHTRIVGGVMAKPGDWPWMVNFDYKHNYANPGHHCGGSLITDEWILSAAHCFYSDLDKSKYWLVLGQHDIRTNTSYEQRIPIADILLHPKYDHSTYDYDHALVKLSRKATITDRVKTICLPDHNTSFPVGTKCFVTGWGLLSISETCIDPCILRQAQVPIVDQKVCKAAHHAHLVSNKMMCAGYAAGGIDSCQGDSGGPLNCKAKDGTWFINGVVSWGVGCGGANSYGVYARTKVLRSWVDQTVFKTS